MSAHTFSFYSADLVPSDPKVWITDDEHFHLARVLRMGAGDVIRVTNGNGLIVSAEIDSVGAKRTTAHVSRVEANLPEPVPLVWSMLQPGSASNAERKRVRIFMSYPERWHTGQGGARKRQ